MPPALSRDSDTVAATESTVRATRPAPAPRVLQVPPAVAGFACILALAGVLEYLVSVQAISPFVVPKPSDIVSAVVRLAAEEGLFSALLVTLGTAASSIALAIVTGVVAGYLLYRYPVWGSAYEPWLAALFSAPLILLYPLFLVVFGRGFGTVVAIGFMTGTIPVIIGTRAALRDVPETLRNVGRSFNATPRQAFWMIDFPAAVPMMFAGIRLCIIYALVNIIGLEFLVDFGGLGRLVSEMYDRFDIPGMYAAILFIILLSGSFLWVLGAIERRVRPE